MADVRDGTQLLIPCSAVRSYSVYALGLLLLLAVCWGVVGYAVWVIVEWAT